MSDFDIAELYRRLDNMVLIGLIHEVDHQKKRLRVRSGETITGWLPWPADIGRNYIQWRPLQPGIQCVMVCPGGEISQGVISQNANVFLFTQSLSLTVFTF